MIIFKLIGSCLLAGVGTVFLLVAIVSFINMMSNK